MLSPAFPNPNVQRNRVLGKPELLRLQALAETNSRIMQILDGEIEQLRGSCDAIHSRYVDLQMELEATQSELHKANDLLTTVQNQRLALQIQQDDLRALMHPIRRCPDEILAEIFGSTVSGLGIPRTRQAICLSSVCQRWRSVALNTPRLWTCISFMLRKPSEEQRFLQNCILPRLKQARADVGIQSINSSSLSALSECGLQDIPVIGKLLLMFSSPASLQHILGPNFHPPVGTLETLYLHSMAPSVRLETQRITTNHDILHLVARFPPFRKLITKSLPNLIFPVAATNANISELDISDLGHLDILRLLQCFPRLRHMTISNAVLVVDDTQSSYHIPSLKSIRLVDTTGEAWVERVSFPKLKTLFYAAGSETLRAFLSRHPSIIELDSVLQGDTIISIAKAAPQLKKLHIAPPLESFCLLLDLNSQMPFPSLKSLTIAANCPPNNLTLADFETVICALCLPMRHPKNQATERSSIVSAFAIVTTLPAQSAHLGWHESDLYKESTKTVDVKDPGKVYLSWPEWE